MKKLILSTLILALTLFFGCSDKNNPVASSSTPNHPPTTAQGIEFQDNTVKLTSQEESMISSVTSNSISFSSTDDVIKNLKVGDVINCGISEKTPNGLLRKITGIQKVSSPNGISFITTIAQMVELIKSGHIDFNTTLFSTSQTLNKLLYGDETNGVKLSGIFNENANLSGYLDFSNSVSAQLKVSLSGSADLALAANLTKSFSNTYNIYNQQLGAIAIWADPPIIVTPTLKIYARLVGNINGSISTGASDNFTIAVALTYDNSWNFDDPESNDFKFKEVEVNLSSDLKLVIGGEVDMLVYETIGPYVNIEEYTDLHADISQTPQWILYDGVQINFGISTGWLSALVPGQTWSTIDLIPETKLASGGTQSSGGWSDDFENYTSGSQPSSWVFDANGTDKSKNYVDNSTSYEGSNSLKLYGQVGGCWAALAYHSINLSPPFTVEFAIRNGDESLSGCHPSRGGIGLREGNSWSNPSRGFIVCRNDSIFAGDNKTFLGSFTTLKWYDIRVSYELITSNSVKLTYWIDGTNITSITVPQIADESKLLNLELNVQEGTAWFDNIIVKNN